MFKSKKTIGSLDFFILGTRLAFTKLRQAFVKAPIFNHFDLEHYIQIKTDVLGYAIGRILSKVTLDDLNQCHLVTFFFWKIILAETRYKTHNSKFWAIVEVFKTWKHYLEGFQHKVFLLTNYNNLCRFINMKNLSSRQVCWAQKLFCYYFQIDYCQDKANRAINTFSCFLHNTRDKEKKLWDENTQILHCLQTSLINGSFSGLGLYSAINLSSLYQVLICKTHVLP